jgi:hypothetical protein
MGNAQSNKAIDKTLPQLLDYEVAKYILEQNLGDMTKLSDINECNKLVILTSKIIEKNLTPVEVIYLTDRIKDKDVMNKDSVTFIKKDNLEKLDVEDKNHKKYLCIGLAKFYIKIAHVFSAILTTMNPITSYKDSTSGVVKQVDLSQKHTIPEDAKISIIKSNNMCSNRINALLNDNDYDVQNDALIKVKPKFCDITSKNLSVEAGIPELENLYFDEYDYENGGFNKMTRKMREEVYEKDVELFYKVFTGNDKLPLDNNGKVKIKKFSDIDLRDYKNMEECRPMPSASTGAMPSAMPGASANDKEQFEKYQKLEGYNKGKTGTLKDKLFFDYATHINTMMNKAEANQSKLLIELKKIFIFGINPTTNKKQAVINPALTELILQGIVENVRKIIKELYINCEIDFLKGLKLFESIVDSTTFGTTEGQINELNRQQEELLNPDPAAPAGPAALAPAALDPAAAALAPAALAPAALAPAALAPAALDPAAAAALAPATAALAPAAIDIDIDEIIGPLAAPVALAPVAPAPPAQAQAPPAANGGNKTRNRKSKHVKKTKKRRN